MPHICVIESGQHWLRRGLVAYAAPKHYPNQCYVIIIGPLGTNFSELLIEIQRFSFAKMHLYISSAKWRPFCPGELSLHNRFIGNRWNILYIKSRSSLYTCGCQYVFRFNFKILLLPSSVDFTPPISNIIHDSIAWNERPEHRIKGSGGGNDMY